MPLVSVVIAVRNGMPFLPETVDSVLSQTLADFELIILDDASQDGTLQYLEQLKDSRVRIEHSHDNLGIAGARNRCFALVQSPYLAVMDADDICLPRRLELQVAFMENNPEVWVCGGQVEIFGDYQWEMPYPLDHDAILAEMLFSSPIAHPASVLRLENFLAHDLRYDEGYHIVSDYLLWVAAAFTGKARFANLPETVLRYRRHGTNITGKGALLLSEYTSVLSTILRGLGVAPTEREISLHMASRFFEPPLEELVMRLPQWFRRLEKANAEKKLIAGKALRLALAKRWHKLGERVVLDRSLAAWRVFCSRYFYGLPWGDEAHMRHELAPRVKRKIRKHVFHLR